MNVPSESYVGGQAHVWRAGAPQPEPEALSFEQMIGYLVGDSLPWVPEETRQSVFGWPQHLLDHSSGSLTLKRRSSGMERQWRGFFSWLLGVIGARHYLGLEGYGWVAHLSAFYKRSSTRVALDHWHKEFPPSVLKAERKDEGLRPDYVALRKRQDRSGTYEWAVVEAKGTKQAIFTQKGCRERWKEQSKNIELFTPEGKLEPRSLSSRVRWSGVEISESRPLSWVG